MEFILGIVTGVFVGIALVVVSIISLLMRKEK